VRAFSRATIDEEMYEAYKERCRGRRDDVQSGYRKVARLRPLSVAKG